MRGAREPALVPSSPLIPVLTPTATAHLSLHPFVSRVSSFPHKPLLGLTTPWREWHPTIVVYE